jgi:tRNA A-37 threonylcarbamoyl transferase component Bud32/tetratricopeptide (TPR) repeat protein
MFRTKLLLSLSALAIITNALAVGLMYTLAKRHLLDEYRAKVAVKLVRPGMDTEFILSRFRRERQTLARLQHPNISRLLDGGTTDHGLPYIVMEYIDGPWITTYAAQNTLGVEARLRLFLAVCSAVDYAHRHFIVHRDLKPGNILVDAGGAPKLLDFGICKLLVENVSANDTVSPPLTPRYASPEQIRGEAATTASDIYSLGAVLYELLTGNGPRRFENLTPVAIQRALESPIVRPSTAVGDPRLARQLAGDVDNILLRALNVEPARRYESAAQLADDLRRHLDHEPVRARRHTFGYRAGTFVRRHRGSTMAAAAVVATLIVGLAVSLREARLADARVAHIRSLASKLVFDVHDAVRDLPGSTQARQMIVQTGLYYLDDLVKSSGRDARAEKELARAYRRLGDVQGNVESANLGDLPGALAQYQKALPILDGAIRREPTDIDARTEQLIVYSRIARIHAETGRLRDALQTFQDGIARASIAAASSHPEFRLALADAYLGSSDAKRNLGDDRGAVEAANECLRLLREAAAAAKQLYEANRSDGRVASDYGILLSRVETAMDDNDPEKVAVQRESLRVLDETARISPKNVTLQNYRALVHLHLGDSLSAAGKIEDARLAYLDSAAISEPSLKLGHASLLVTFMRANQRLALNAVARTDALAFAARALQAARSDPAFAAAHGREVREVEEALLRIERR